MSELLNLMVPHNFFPVFVTPIASKGWTTTNPLTFSSRVVITKVVFFVKPLPSTLLKEKKKKNLFKSPGVKSFSLKPNFLFELSENDLTPEDLKRLSSSFYLSLSTELLLLI